MGVPDARGAGPQVLAAAVSDGRSKIASENLRYARMVPSHTRDAGEDVKPAAFRGRQLLRYFAKRP